MTRTEIIGNCDPDSVNALIVALQVPEWKPNEASFEDINLWNLRERRNHEKTWFAAQARFTIDQLLRIKYVETKEINYDHQISSTQPTQEPANNLRFSALGTLLIPEHDFHKIDDVALHVQTDKRAITGYHFVAFVRNV